MATVSKHSITITLDEEVSDPQSLALLENCWVVVKVMGLTQVATVSLHLQPAMPDEPVAAKAATGGLFDLGRVPVSLTTTVRADNPEITSPRL